MDLFKKHINIDRNVLFSFLHNTTCGFDKFREKNSQRLRMISFKVDTNDLGHFSQAFFA